MMPGSAEAPLLIRAQKLDEEVVAPLVGEATDARMVRALLPSSHRPSVDRGGDRAGVRRGGSRGAEGISVSGTAGPRLTGPNGRPLVVVPLAFSSRMMAQPAASRAAICTAVFWSAFCPTRRSVVPGQR
jgi:hypothetical protein